MSARDRIEELAKGKSVIAIGPRGFRVIRKLRSWYESGRRKPQLPMVVDCRMAECVRKPARRIEWQGSALVDHAASGRDGAAGGVEHRRRCRRIDWELRGSFARANTN